MGKQGPTATDSLQFEQKQSKSSWIQIKICLVSDVETTSLGFVRGSVVKMTSSEGHVAADIVRMKDEHDCRVQADLRVYAFIKHLWWIQAFPSNLAQLTNKHMILDIRMMINNETTPRHKTSLNYRLISSNLQDISTSGYAQHFCKF